MKLKRKKKKLAPWKESYDKSRQHIKNQRHHFADKGPYSQSCGFPNSHAQIWELDHEEGWPLKNGCFQIVVLEKTLESWLDRWRSNQSILKKIDLEYSLEEQMLKPHTLASRWEEPTHWKKTLMLGKTEGRRRRGWQRLYGIIDSMDINLSNHWEIVKGRGTWCAVVQLQSWTWLSDWTIITLRKKTEVERANELFFCFLSSLKLRFLQLATESDLMSTLRNSNLSVLWYLYQLWNFFV